MKNQTQLLKTAVLATGAIAAIATWSSVPDVTTGVLLTTNIALTCVVILAVTVLIETQRTLHRLIPTLLKVTAPKDTTTAPLVPPNEAREKGVHDSDLHKRCRTHACFLWHTGHFDSQSMVREFTNIGGPATHVSIMAPPGVDMSISSSTLPTESGGRVRATHPQELPVPFSFTIIYSDRLGDTVHKHFTFTRTSMHLSAAQ